MSTDALLTGFRLLAIMISGAAGVFALFVSYKDPSGNITRGGAVALLLVVTSTIVAAAIQVLDTDRQNAARLAQARQNGETLREIHRGLYPITQVELGLDIRLADLPSDFTPYLTRIAHYVSEHRSYADHIDDDDYVLLEDNHTRTYPRRATELVPYTALLQPEIILHVFKDQTRQDCYWRDPARNIGCQADLELHAEPPPEDNIGILVGLKTGNIIMHISGLTAKVTAVREGIVTAIPDLVNTHMSIELRYGDNDDLWISQLLAKAVATKLFAIRIGSVSIPVSIRNTPRGTPGHGHILDVDFPSSEEALWQRPTVAAHGP